MDEPPPLFPTLAPVRYRKRRNPVAHYLGNPRLSRETLRSRRSSLEVIARVASGDAIPADTFPWKALGVWELQHLVEALLHLGLKSATINARLVALRGMVRSLFSVHMIGSDERDRRIDELACLQILREAPGRFVPPAERQALLTAALKHRFRHRAARDAAVLAFVFAGPRRDEIGKIRLEHVDAATGRFHYVGKRGKARVGNLQGVMLEQLRDYLRIRGDEPGRLIYRVDREGEFMRSPAPMTGGAIYYILEQLRLRADTPHLSPHDGRRTYCTILAELVRQKRIPLTDALLASGHERVETFMLYQRPTDDPLGGLFDEVGDLFGG